MQLKKIDAEIKGKVAAAVLPQLPIEPVLPVKPEVPVVVVTAPTPETALILCKVHVRLG